MAKTVDELVLRMTVEGTAQVKDSTVQMNNLEAATNKTSAAMKQGQQNIRNVAFQVQDLAVQIAGGTSAFVALGQQLPQLLGGFGVMGAVVGALAAVSIPLLRAGLQAAGVDMRDLNERIDDLDKSVKLLQSAQKDNASTLVGLANQYGVVTQEAKRFFQVQEDLRQQKVRLDVLSALDELRSRFRFATDEANQQHKEMQKYLGQYGDYTGVMKGLGDAFNAWRLGLTVEQAKKVADELKNIDNSNPEKTAKTINNILEYLASLGPAGAQARKRFEDLVDPLLKLNQAIIQSNENIKNAAIEATKFNAELLNLQASFVPRVGEAKRAYDQIGAVRLEAAQKIAEFEKQIRDKSAKDGVSREAELSAFRTKVNAETLQKEKDIAQQQWETYRGSYLTNETKLRQIDLERKIIALKDRGLFDTEYNLQYDEAILKTQAELADELQRIGELRRKNQISAEQATRLEKEARDIAGEKDLTAATVRNAAVRKKMILDEMEISKKSIEDQIARNEKLGEVIRSIRDQRIGVEFEAAQMGRSPLERQIAQIREDSRKAALEAGRAYAQAFQDQGDGLTPERAQELADGLKQIADGYGLIAEKQIENLNKSREWSQGWADAYKEFYENATNSAQIAKDVFATFTGGLENALVKLATTGKLSFKDLANSIIADLARIYAKQMIVGLFGKPLGGGTTEGGILSSVFNAFTGLFKAQGGPVSANRPYIIGEKGAELFIPRSSGSVIPNNQLAMAGAEPAMTNVTYNIQAVDASSFRQLVARDPSFIYAVTEQGRRSQPSRR